MSATREELILAIDEAEWEWLRPHLERDALILVDNTLDLAEAAYRIARDDSDAVNRWLAEGRLGKPGPVETDRWNLDLKRKFAMLIVSPFVLIQER